MCRMSNSRYDIASTDFVILNSFKAIFLQQNLVKIASQGFVANWTRNAAGEYVPRAWDAVDCDMHVLTLDNLNAVVKRLRKEVTVKTGSRQPKFPRLERAHILNVFRKFTLLVYNDEQGSWLQTDTNGQKYIRLLAGRLATASDCSRVEQQPAAVKEQPYIKHALEAQAAASQSYALSLKLRIIGASVVPGREREYADHEERILALDQKSARLFAVSKQEAAAKADEDREVENILLMQLMKLSYERKPTDTSLEADLVDRGFLTEEIADIKAVSLAWKKERMFAGEAKARAEIHVAAILAGR